jgi:hypothetical protein
MAGCGRQWCAGCGEELIHRDHRKGYESASALGQIVGREGPVNLSVADIDLATRKLLPDGRVLLWLLEQKQPEHKLGSSQGRILYLLDDCVDHCTTCPGAADLRLHPSSGLLFVRGHIAGSMKGRHETRFDGPQTIVHVRSGKTVIATVHEEFFRVLDPVDRSRRQRMGWKRG